MTSARRPRPELHRALGLLDAVGIGFGAIVGAGIFVVTGVAAGIAGPAFLVGLFVAAVAATCNALSSAQLAARFPHAGGTYEYGYQVLTPAAGFAAGWMFLAGKIDNLFSNTGTSVESRTSSPVRVPRRPDALTSPDLDGLYPCGEGAGYAGGIMANNGFKANKDSTFWKDYNIEVELKVIDDYPASRAARLDPIFAMRQE